MIHSESKTKDVERMKSYLSLLKIRRSIRDYKSKEIAMETLTDIIDFARLAPSSKNLQPWKFIVITERRTLCQIAEITERGKFIANAAACVAVVCNSRVSSSVEDGFIASENIIIGAWIYEIGSCLVAGYNKRYSPEIGLLLNIPTEYQSLSLISLGYPQNVPQAPTKRDLTEVLHWEQF